MSIPIYQVILDELRKEIDTLPVNSKFYSERELAKNKDISRMTARRVLGCLIEENLIYSVVNVGTFIADKEISSEEDSSTFSLTDTRLKFTRIFYNIKKVEKDMAEKLNISPSDNIIIVTYITRLDNKIYSIEEVYMKYSHNDLCNIFMDKDYDSKNPCVNNLVVHQSIRLDSLPIKYGPWMKVNLNTPVMKVENKCYYLDSGLSMISISYLHPTNGVLTIK